MLRPRLGIVRLARVAMNSAVAVLVALVLLLRHLCFPPTQAGSSQCSKISTSRLSPAPSA